MSNALYVRDPFREFDSLVNWAFGPRTSAVRTGFAPAVESERDGEDLLIRLELPGIDVAEDVSVELRNGQLIISGERQASREESDENRRFSEFKYGAFSRSFRVGSRVDADQVSASYDAGILTVRVSGVFSEPVGHTIPISAAGEVTAADAE